MGEPCAGFGSRRDSDCEVRRPDICIHAGMIDPVPDELVQGGLTEEQKRESVVRLAFGGRTDVFDTFRAEIERVIPPGTIVILRGSAVTGRRWKDDAPFDSDGPGT